MTGGIRTITYECIGDEKSIEILLLQLTAELVSVPLTVVKAGGSTTSLSLSKTITNTFTNTTVTTNAIGLTGCIRMLCSTCTELYEGISSASTACGESWLQTSQQTLLPIIKQEKKDELFLLTVENFTKQIESFLYINDSTYLLQGGAYGPSIIDVIVAILIASAFDVVNLKKVPQQTYRWLQTTLHRLIDTLEKQKLLPSTVKKLNTWCTKIEEGDASPETKPILEPLPTTSTAPAAVATTETTTKETTPTPAATKPAAAPAATTTTTTDSDNPILSLLNQYGLEHEVYEHTLCMTAEELISNVPLPSDKETHTKNLFLRDKKHGLFLVTVHPSSNVQTKELGTKLGLKGKTNLRLADEKILDEILHVKPGCVGPLSIGLADQSPSDEKNKVTLVFDETLLKYDLIHSHPIRNDMSVKLKPSTMKAFFDKCKVEPTYLDFGGSGSGGGAATKTATAPAPAPPKATKPAQQQQPKAPKQKKSAAEKEKQVAPTKKGETLLALQWKKSENFAQWYTDVIVLSEMISYYDISGCYILRPWSYKMWELIQEWFNVKIDALGVENAYFPMFVTQDRLEKEKDHVEGFAPEVAWVTKSGDGDLAKPIAVRPTSETIMYPAYSDWIRSHRDLPLKLNQWSNVVRWEFKYPTPFLRTREFLWQEGHTAHVSFEDADDMVMKALDLYRGVYEELLAVPVIKGYKTEKEKFAGGYRTTTCEAYIAGSGRAIQGATSHNLGQNFGKMFDITFQDEQGKKQIAWQTSWGLTTRTIGVMVMTHGDDIGLVVPPRVAPIQVVIVPIISKKLTNEIANPYCESILNDLKSAGVRVKYDDRTMYNPGWKYNHWEQKGVPIRIEVGPRDMEKKSCRIVIRHNSHKEDMSIDGIGTTIQKLLEDIQNDMFTKAKDARDTHIAKITKWEDFVPNLELNNLVLTPWCGGEYQDWEEHVKDKSREESLASRGESNEDEKTSTSVAAKTLCIPFEQPELPEGTMCIASGLPAKCWVLWGRSY